MLPSTSSAAYCASFDAAHSGTWDHCSCGRSHRAAFASGGRAAIWLHLSSGFGTWRCSRTFGRINAANYARMQVDIHRVSTERAQGTGRAVPIDSRATKPLPSALAIITGRSSPGFAEAVADHHRFIVAGCASSSGVAGAIVGSAPHTAPTGASTAADIPCRARRSRAHATYSRGRQNNDRRYCSSGWRHHQQIKGFDLRDVLP